MSAPDAKNSGGEIVITFEDLHAQGRAMGPLPSGYAGFTWSESAWFMTRAFSLSVCGGRFGLLNAHGGDMNVKSKRLFDLKRLSLWTLWKDDAQVLVEGWENEARKYATTLTVKRSSVNPFELDYRAIDRVELKTGGDHIVINPITVFLK